MLFAAALLFLPARTRGQGLEGLAGKISAGVAGYFSTTIGEIRTSITRFENFSDISDLAAQKFYQILVSKLEADRSLNFTDLMVNFNQKKGEFNLNRAGRLNHYLYLKLIRKRDKLGVGIVIFSLNLDRIVFIKYVETPFLPGERDIYETRHYGFKGAGFVRGFEIEARENLLDFKTIRTPGGEPQYFFFYLDRLEIYNMRNRRFKKFFSFPLEWERPYYPVLIPEGRMTVFHRDDQLYLTVGGNFSQRAGVFRYREHRWSKVTNVDFIPLRLISFNSGQYLFGARYSEGKNFFDGTLLLVPWQDGQPVVDSLLEKQVPPFYAVDVSGPEDSGVEAVHLMDTGYNYRFFSGDFEERTVDPEKRGAALAALSGQWLAVSDYSLRNDTLFFYKIENAARRLVYQRAVEGQVAFISPGYWGERTGFWFYILKKQKGHDKYSLQFWSENNG